MHGALIGDIVGSRFEFDNHRSKDFELFTDACEATDDSVMSLAVAKAIVETARALPQERTGSRGPAFYGLLRQNAIRWMKEIGRQYRHCGYGGRFYHWVFSDSDAPYDSFGNGAAMRVSAAAFAAGSEEEALKMAEAVTDVTHNHPEGVKGAKAAALAIYLARTGQGKEDIKARIEKDYYPLDFTIDQIRPTYHFNETCQGTVPQAIRCFLESDSFEDTIRTAVSLGGDSDTLAAIAGPIAEAFWGIPGELWKRALPFLDSTLKGLYDEWVAFRMKDSSPAG